MMENEETETIFGVDDADIPFKISSKVEEIAKILEADEEYNIIKARIKDNRWTKQSIVERRFYMYRWRMI